MRLRVATDEDVVNIANIHHVSTHAGYSAFLPAKVLRSVTVESRLPCWRERFTEEQRIIVASDAGVDVGFVYLIDSPEFLCREQDYPEISHLFVIPEYWNRGVGRALCEEVCKHVRENGGDRVLVWAFTANVQARDAYQHWGFVLDGETRNYKYEGVEFPQVRFVKSLAV